MEWGSRELGFCIGREVPELLGRQWKAGCWGSCDRRGQDPQQPAFPIPLCIKTAQGVSGRKERGHWPPFQESERSNRVLLGTAIAAAGSLVVGRELQQPAFLCAL